MRAASIRTLNPGFRGFGRPYASRIGACGLEMRCRSACASVHRTLQHQGCRYRVLAPSLCLLISQRIGNAGDAWVRMSSVSLCVGISTKSQRSCMMWNPHRPGTRFFTHLCLAAYGQAAIGARLAGWRGGRLRVLEAARAAGSRQSGQGRGLTFLPTPPRPNPVRPLPPLGCRSCSPLDCWVLVPPSLDRELAKLDQPLKPSAISPSWQL